MRPVIKDTELARRQLGSRSELARRTTLARFRRTKPARRTTLARACVLHLGGRATCCPSNNDARLQKFAPCGLAHRCRGALRPQNCHALVAFARRRVGFRRTIRKGTTTGAGPPFAGLRLPAGHACFAPSCQRVCSDCGVAPAPRATTLALSSESVGRRGPAPRAALAILLQRLKHGPPCPTKCCVG